MSEKPIEEGFVQACRAAEVPEMMPKKVEIEGRSILICRQGDDYFAVDEICPHKQKSMAMGIVFDKTIICPWHQYAFDLETGRCNQRRCAPAHTFEARLVDGVVFVKV